MRERVLVVDDSKPICQFLADSILSPANFEVIVAHDGIKGLEKALTQRPDLIITDNQMPGMTGLELLRELHDRGVDAPSILMTAHGSEQIAVEGFRVGIRDYVIKPFEPEEMHRAIERALREARLERERDELLQKQIDSNAQLQRRLQEINTLYGIGKSVSSSLNIEEVLRRVVDAAVYVTSAEEGSLLLLDNTQGELYVRASKNMETSTRSMRLRVNDSLAGQVLRTKKPLFIDDDDRWQKIKTAYLVKSLIYVPLISEGRAIGVLGVANRGNASAFEKRDTRVLSMLADYAAISIRNANLFSESERQRVKLETILRQTNDPVLVIDYDGNLVLANGAAHSALQMAESNSANPPVIQLVQDNEIAAFLDELMRQDDWDMQHELRVPDGRIFNVSVSQIENLGRSIVMHDITQLKELDRLKSEFVSVVSHDLRSPLTSILGYVDLMERGGPLTPEQESYVGRVKQSVSNITALINDLLDLGRLEAGIDMTMAMCDPDQLMRDIVEEFTPTLQEAELNVEMRLSEEPIFILGDQRRLHQAFSNLINNAIKYTPPGGTITLESTLQDEQVIIRISDTGIGIAPAEQPYIFDKFFRSENVTMSHEGTGLGLSIVKSVIERHQGRIYATSELNAGTTFSIVMPVIKTPALLNDPAQ